METPKLVFSTQGHSVLLEENSNNTYARLMNTQVFHTLNTQRRDKKRTGHKWHRIAHIVVQDMRRNRIKNPPRARAK